ncbi:MAG TPA: MaoC family dehydratase N-terminal domain-containing protein [Rhodospirillales bacterium]|jgi:acyl dehydratase|nr:MaoC family dehydratase N-terminal domain-containing protein [Rhodospirillales bacterium]
METLGLGLHWNDLEVGYRFRTVGRTVTEADITAFISCVGIPELMFTNIEYIEQESAIRGRAAPGALVFSMAEGLLVQATMMGTGLAFLNMELNVEGPVLAGDTIHVECEVIESRPASRGNRGLVRTLNKIVNQRGETVITYSPLRMMKGRD